MKVEESTMPKTPAHPAKLTEAELTQLAQAQVRFFFVKNEKAEHEADRIGGLIRDASFYAAGPHIYRRLRGLWREAHR